MAYEIYKTLGTWLIVVGIALFVGSIAFWFLWHKRLRRRMVERYGNECCFHLARNVWLAYHPVGGRKKSQKHFWRWAARLPQTDRKGI